MRQIWLQSSVSLASSLSYKASFSIHLAVPSLYLMNEISFGNKVIQCPSRSKNWSIKETLLTKTTWDLLSISAYSKPWIQLVYKR